MTTAEAAIDFTLASRLRQSFVLLDMDGVLVDFGRGAHEYYGLPYDHNSIKEWAWYKSSLGLSSEEFWAPFGFDFWSRLPWMWDGQYILQAVEDLVGDTSRIMLLTTPCPTKGCVEGKQKWLDRYLHSYRHAVIFSDKKEDFALPETILIDDYPGNIQKFREAGGRAIMVPRPWNDLRDLHPDSVVEYVKKELSDALAEIG